MTINSLKNQLDSFKKTGHCTVKDAISKEKLKLLNSYIVEVIDYLKENGDEGIYVNYANKKNKLVNSIHRINELKHKGINTFIDENNFKEIAQYLIGEECELFSIQAFLKPPGIGLRTPAHQDNAYWCLEEGKKAITIWLSLDKAGKFNGMMKYAINSNNSLVEHISSSNTPGSSLIIPEDNLNCYEWRQPDLDPGDLSIHDGLVIHFSEKNNSNFARRGFLLNYKSVKNKKDVNKFNAYISKLEKIYER